MASIQRRLVSLLLLVLTFTASATGATIRFNIPSQSLSEALRLFADQSKMQLAYKPEAISGGVSNTVIGDYDKREALERLVKDTGYEVVFSSSNLATVLPKNEAPHEAIASEDNAKSDDHRLKIAQSDSTAVSPSSETEAKTSDQIQEIVVTAQKREERLQDVPISITAITADQIGRKGLVHGEDYLRGIPGVNQAGGHNSYGGNLIVFRGMQTSLRPEGGNGTTGTYFGEAPTIGTGGSYGSSVDIQLVDIERVEVLRGPQGTAFGSSSLGGTVRVIPAAPALDRMEGKLAAGYSATSGSGDQNHNYQGVGNIPLVQDKLAIRAVAYAFSEDGYYRNQAGSDPAYQTNFVIPLGAQALAADSDEVGAYRSVGGRLTALFRPLDNLDITLSYLTQKNELDGFAVQNSGDFEQNLLRIAPEHVRRGQNGGYHDNQIDIASAILEYDLGWADVLGSYSYIKGESEFGASAEAFALQWAASYGAPSSIRKNVGEVRIATKFDGRWNFLAGLYRDDRDSRNVIDVVWTGAATNPFGQRTLLHDIGAGELRQNAAFGQVSWQFLPRFTLTGGARVFEYDNDGRLDRTGAFGILSQRDSMKDSGSIYRASLTYKPDDRAMLYAAWSQGFRLGGAGASPPAASCDVDGDGILDGTTAPLASVGDVSSDTVDNYEIGGKFSLFERRVVVDATIFRMDWSDIPVNSRLPAPCSFSYVGNAGGARSEGVELQSSLQVTESVQIDIGGSYVNAKLTTPIPALGVPSERQLPGTPEFNGNVGLQYGFTIAGHSAHARVDSIYVGPFSGNVTLPPNTEAGDYIKLDASARVSLNRLDIDLFIRNLTNEDAFTFRDAVNRGALYGYRMRPRTIGMQLSFNF